MVALYADVNVTEVKGAVPMFKEAILKIVEFDVVVVALLC